MDVRLILDGPAPGVWNMALDEALLHSVGEAGQGGCLRFYSWEQPTLSLGYFQRHDDRWQHLPSRACPVVRRSTGGGAIIHANELTYSFAMPLSSHWDTLAKSMYAAFHETLVEELMARGVPAFLCENPAPVDQEPFLCFLRRASGDVLLERQKIGGSAQRRYRRGLLQHGSILLKTTAESPELAGIEDVSDVQVNPRELAECWSRRLSQRLGIALDSSPTSGREIKAAKMWIDSRFGNADWTCKR